jgi:hypothetical protein
MIAVAMKSWSAAAAAAAAAARVEMIPAYDDSAVDSAIGIAAAVVFLVEAVAEVLVAVAQHLWKVLRIQN